MAASPLRTAKQLQLEQRAEEILAQRKATRKVKTKQAPSQEGKAEQAQKVTREDLMFQLAQ